MPIELNTTVRGFSIIEFHDQYEQPCSLQRSSLVEPDCVWFGVDKRIDLNTGALLPDSKNMRMHLSRDRLRELLPYLQRFVETGELFEPTNEDG